MRTLHTPVQVHELTWYIFTRGLWLTCLLLAAAIVMLSWPAPSAGAAWRLDWYAGYLQTMSAVMLGTALIGPLLLEDVLRNTRRK